MVIPAGSEIGLEIFRSVHPSTHFDLVGAGYSNDHAAYVYPDYHAGIPWVDNDDFVPALVGLCRRTKADFIFPAHDSAVLKLAESAGQLPATLIGSPVQTARICRSKSETYRFLADKIPTPVMYSVNDSVDGPRFLKPDAGQGSKGTFRAENIEEVLLLVRRDPSLLISEYLPGPEYTIDCFTDRFGVLRFAGGRSRSRIASGISVSATAVDHPAFREYAEIINRHLKFRGAWFFQLKERASSELVLLEIAPRISGTSGYFRNKGVNLPLLSLYDAMDIDIQISPNSYALTMDRALQNRFKSDLQFRAAYVDLDDTLIVRGQINTALITFIYQCRNEQKAVHLVTRHRRDLSSTLQQFALTSCFTSIVHLQAGEPKSRAISENDSILIDDSYRERAEVAAARGIPAFGLDMLEMLLK
jgi:hypothetical protein